MIWFIGVAVVLAISLLVAGARSEVNFGDPNHVIRPGKRISEIPHNKVLLAWTQGDLPTMLRSLTEPAHPVDRHFLLLRIVEEAYQARKKNKNMERLFEQASRRHIYELPLLEPYLREDGVLPNIPTFRYFATHLVEHGRYTEAERVCMDGLSLGLPPGSSEELRRLLTQIQSRSACEEVS